MKSEQDEGLERTIITIASGKGGVGKTSIAVNLAKILSGYGKVLLIDLDLYVRGLTHFVYWGIPGRRTISKMDLTNFVRKFPDIEKDQEHNRSAVRTYLPGFLDTACIKLNEMLHLLPSSSSTDQTVPLEPKIVPLPLLVLLEELRVRHDYEYIIIDTRAGADRGTIIPILFSDVCIIVSEEDMVSQFSSYNFVLHIGRFQEKYKDLLKTFDREKRTPQIEIIMNKVTRKETVTRRFMDGVEGAMRKNRLFVYNPLDRYIPYDPLVKDAFLDGEYVVETSPLSPFSLFLTSLVSEIDPSIGKLPTKRIRRLKAKSFYRNIIIAFVGVYAVGMLYFYLLFSKDLSPWTRGLILGVLSSFLGVIVGLSLRIILRRRRH